MRRAGTLFLGSRSNGRLNSELIKLFAIILMTGDHVNKYLFNATLPYLYELGRVAMPLFVFVLAYNLALPTNLASGVYARVLRRTAIFAIVSAPIYIALGKLYYGWYPLNILFTLLVVVLVVFMVERGNFVFAFAAFLVGGGIVEFWWPAISYGVGVWWFYRYGQLRGLMVALASIIGLYFINGNSWALAAIPVIIVCSRVTISLPRARWFFYVYYPLHLAAIYYVRSLMEKAGYWFF